MWRTQNKYQPINLLQIVTISPFVFDYTIMPIIICNSKNIGEKTNQWKWNCSRTSQHIHTIFDKIMFTMANCGWFISICVFFCSLSSETKFYLHKWIRNAIAKTNFNEAFEWMCKHKKKSTILLLCIITPWMRTKQKQWKLKLNASKIKYAKKKVFQN